VSIDFIEFFSASDVVWKLTREPQIGLIFVRREEGETISHINIGDFLRAKPQGPEHVALLQLIGSLIPETREGGRDPAESKRV
jgi:hypothetical protein